MTIFYKHLRLERKVKQIPNEVVYILARRETRLVKVSGGGHLILLFISSIKYYYYYYFIRTNKYCIHVVIFFYYYYFPTVILLPHTCFPSGRHNVDKRSLTRFAREDQVALDYRGGGLFHFSTQV